MSIIILVLKMEKSKLNYWWVVLCIGDIDLFLEAEHHFAYLVSSVHFFLIGK